MTDVLFLIGTVVAFGVLVLLLRGCEKIVGSEHSPSSRSGRSRSGPSGPDRLPTRRRAVRCELMSAGDVIGLVLSGLVLVYLLVVLIAPEKF